MPNAAARTRHLTTPSLDPHSCDVANRAPASIGYRVSPLGFDGIEQHEARIGRLVAHGFAKAGAVPESWSVTRAAGQRSRARVERLDLEELRQGQTFGEARELAAVIRAWRLGRL